MLFVDWRGGIGYGDTLNTITYSFSSTYKFDCSVHTTVHWPFDIDYKPSSVDPETVLQRFEYVVNTMKPGKHDVSFSHVFRDSVPSFRYINNFEYANPMHGVWYNNQKQKDLGKVVVWSSRHNTEPVAQYKDPSIDQWDVLIDHLRHAGFEVVEVTYRMKIDDVFKHINECTFGIGYDGMVHQFFKYLWKPVSLICSRKSLNNLLLPQAVIYDTIQQFIDQDINKSYKMMVDALSQVRTQHELYLNEKYQFSKHELYNVPL